MNQLDPFASGKPSRTDAVRPARVKWKIKGQTNGPVYAGTVQVKPCTTCGQPKVSESIADASQAHRQENR